MLLGIATLLAGFYTWITHRLIRLGTPWWFAVLLVALATKGCSFHFFARPHLATLVLLGWTFARLCDFEAGRVSFRGLFWLVPVIAVWANTHGGVVGGIGTIGLTIAGWALFKVMGRPGPVMRYQQLLPLAGLVLACIIVTLVNPYGLELPRTWAAVMSSSAVHERIIEHLPLLRSPYAWTVVAFGVVYAAMLVSVPPSRVRITWLVAAAWFILAWDRVRNGPLFAALGIIALADMLPEVRWSAALFRWGNRVLPLPGNARARPGWRSLVIPIAAVAIAFGFQTTGILAPLIGHGWRGWRRRHGRSNCSRPCGSMRRRARPELRSSTT